MTKSIQLPAGTEYVRYDELAHLIADALWPATEPDDDRMDYGFARASLDAELKTAVCTCAIELKDPLTFGPHTFPVGNALNSALMTVDDLRAFVAGRGLSVEVGSVLKATPKKLTADQETEIRKCRKNGETTSSLARRFKVSRPTIDKCFLEKTAKTPTLESTHGIGKPSRTKR